MRTIQDIPDLANKKVLLRTDFDVPVADDGTITETFRIVKQKETIDYLVSRGAHVVMVAHASDVDSFAKILAQLEKILGYSIRLLEQPDDIEKYVNNHPDIALLEDVRKFDGEIRNDEEFAKRLARGFDYYINNAFAVSHRNQASVSAITKFLPSYAGLQVIVEVRELEKALAASPLGKVVVIGGAKASTKVPMIQNFLDKSDAIILGGVVANDILKAKGFDVDASKVDESLEEVLGTLDLKSDKIMLPHDFNILENKILDIGPQSIDKFEQIISHAKMVIWNGPMGLFEDANFAKGTEAVARAILASGAVSVLGGGDTVSAVDHLGILEQFTFVSTGGGAMLEFLAGKTLRGLIALQ